jgi:hypothetical protein
MNNMHDGEGVRNDMTGLKWWGGWGKTAPNSVGILSSLHHGHNYDNDPSHSTYMPEGTIQIQMLQVLN